MGEKPYELKVDKWAFRVYRDRFYTENDSWARAEGDVITVGITDFLQNNAGDIVFTECLKTGSNVEQFDEVASFESVKTMLDVISPVSGTVVKTNPRLESEPELVNKDANSEGWFVKIKANDFEADKKNLLSPENYYEILKKKAETERLKLKQKSENSQKE